jgi:hypothetical protein
LTAKNNSFSIIGYRLIFWRVILAISVTASVLSIKQFLSDVLMQDVSSFELDAGSLDNYKSFNSEVRSGGMYTDVEYLNQLLSTFRNYREIFIRNLFLSSLFNEIVIRVTEILDEDVFLANQFRECLIFQEPVDYSSVSVVVNQFLCSGYTNQDAIIHGIEYEESSGGDIASFVKKKIMFGDFDIADILFDDVSYKFDRQAVLDSSLAWIVKHGFIDSMKYIEYVLGRGADKNAVVEGKFESYDKTALEYAESGDMDSDDERAKAEVLNLLQSACDGSSGGYGDGSKSHNGSGEGKGKSGKQGGKKVGKGVVDRVNRKAKSGKGINVEGADLENQIVLNSKNKLGVVRKSINNKLLLDMGNGQYSLESSSTLQNINIIPKFNPQEMLLRSALNSKNWRSELSKIGIRSSRLVRYMDSIISKGSAVSDSQSVYIKSLRAKSLVQLESKRALQNEWFDSALNSRGDTVEYFKNPTLSELKDIYRNSKEKAIRIILTDGVVYAWDGYLEVHSTALHFLKLPVLNSIFFELGKPDETVWYSETNKFNRFSKKEMETQVANHPSLQQYMNKFVSQYSTEMEEYYDKDGEKLESSKSLLSMVVDDVYPETAFQDILEANFGDRGTVSFDEMAPATEGDVTEWRDLFTVVFTDVTTGLKGMLFFEFFEKVKGRHEEVVDWGVDSISFDVVGDGESSEYAVEFGNANIDSRNFDRDLVDGIRVSFTEAVIGIEDKFSADLQEQLFNMANAYAAVRGTDKVKDVLEDIIYELRLSRVTWQELEAYFESLIKQGEGIAASIYKSNPDSVVFWSDKGLMCSVGGRVRLASEYFDLFKRGDITYEIIKNPSKSDIKGMGSWKSQGEVRCIYDSNSSILYIMDALGVLHGDVIGVLLDKGYSGSVDDLFQGGFVNYSGSTLLALGVNSVDDIVDILYEDVFKGLADKYQLVFGEGDEGGIFTGTANEIKRQLGIESSIKQAESKQGAMIKDGQYLSFQFNVPFDIEIDGENISYQQFEALLLTADVDLNTYLQEKLFNDVFIGNLLKFFGSADSATPSLTVLPYFTQSANSEYAGVIEVVATVFIKEYKSYAIELTEWLQKYRFDMYKKRFSFGDSSFIFRKDDAWVDELPTVVRDGIGTFVEVGYSPDYYRAVLEQAIDKEKAYSKVEGCDTVILVDSNDIYNSIIPIIESEGGIDRESILSVDVDKYGRSLIMYLSPVAVDAIENSMVYLYDSVSLAVGSRIDDKVGELVDAEGVLSRAGNQLVLGISTGADSAVVFSDKYKVLHSPSVKDLMVSSKKQSLKSMFLNTVLLDEVNKDGVLRLDMGVGFDLVPVDNQKWANFKGYFDVSGSKDLYFDLIGLYDYFNGTEGIDLSMYVSDFVIESVEDFESYLCSRGKI